MKKWVSVYLLFVILSIGYVTSAQEVMPDFVLRAAQQINAIYGEGTLDLNSTGWNWRGGSIGDNFPLTEGCNQPLNLPATTSATGYNRVFFDTNIDGTDDWVVVVYSDFSYFGLCTAPQYQCGLLEPRLIIGDIGHVDPDGFPNNLRAQPGESGQLSGEIPAGAEFTVIDGPRCASDISFWLVSYDGSQGWTAEGQGESYFVNPGAVPTGDGAQPTSASPTAVAEPTQIPIFTCAGITSRLYVGRMAQVTPGLPNNIRAQPGESGAYVGEIPPGVPFEIVGGPQCNSNLQWWQVNYQGTIGWTAEAGSVDDYWLEPVSVGVTPISNGTINLLASYANLVPLVSGAPQTLYINARNEVPIIMPNCEAIWIPENPTAVIPDSWFMRPDCEITPNSLASRLDAADDVVRLVRNPANNQLITLEGGTFFDEFDLSRDNNTLDVAAFHPDDGDMIIVSQRGMGFILINSDPDSPAYRQVSQAARILAPNEIFTAMKFSADGTRLAALTDANNLLIWQGLTKDPGAWGALYPILSASNVTIHDFALSPDGSKLIVVGTQINGTSQVGFYGIYDLTDTSAGTMTLTHPPFTNALTAVEFTPDGSLFVLATGRQSGQVDLMLMDTNSNTQIRVIEDISEPIIDIAFKDDASLMATIFENSVVTMWRIN